MVMRCVRVVILACVFALSACGGGGGGSSSSTSGGGDPGSSPPPPPVPPPEPPPASYPDIPATDADAARFLTQATFGVNDADIANLRKIGYSKWLDEQLSDTTAPATLVLSYLQQLVANGVPALDLNQQNRRQYWLWQAANAHDQLRMRMSFALSEIFVVSDLGLTGLVEPTFRFADYQDTLARGAFGSYRDLLEKVSLHPAMGFFLTYAGNRKADPANNIAPDENYGREVMQLMSIGLLQRNSDFTPILDNNGATIPTFDQPAVKAMARVFTGWAYPGQSDQDYGQQDLSSYAPMECHPAYHDTASKTIFDGTVINNGDDCTADLKIALDALANHANTAPFISRQLIQRFVTSNPSPAYVARVASVWKSSGGNLGQVLRAILLDVVARLPPTDPGFGKAREPLVKMAAVWRAFGAVYTPDPATGELEFRYVVDNDLARRVGQDVLRAPSVFNFFEPDFRLPSTDGVEGIFAPEFQIHTEATYLGTVNLLDDMVWDVTTDQSTVDPYRPFLNISALIAMSEAKDYAGMVQRINLLLFYGSLSDATQKVMIDLLEQLESYGNSPSERARSLILLAIDSPEFAIQR